MLKVIVFSIIWLVVAASCATLPDFVDWCERSPTSAICPDK